MEDNNIREQMEELDISAVKKMEEEEEFDISIVKREEDDFSESRNLKEKASSPVEKKSVQETENDEKNAEYLGFEASASGVSTQQIPSDNISYESDSDSHIEIIKRCISRISPICEELPPSIENITIFANRALYEMEQIYPDSKITDDQIKEAKEKFNEVLKKEVKKRYPKDLFEELEKFSSLSPERINRLEKLIYENLERSMLNVKRSFVNMNIAEFGDLDLNIEESDCESINELKVKSTSVVEAMKNSWLSLKITSEMLKQKLERVQEILDNKNEELELKESTTDDEDKKPLKKS